MILLEFSITPLGAGESVSPYVARAVRIVRDSGLPHQTHAMGTLIEGEWDPVMDVVKQCLDALAADNDRVSCSIKIDYRKGRSGRIQSKVKSLEQKL